MVLIAGTGSIAFGRNRQGEIHRCGGWPPCIYGDEGSGVWLNEKALEYMSHVLDGRKKRTLLYDLLNQELVIQGPKDLIRICQRIEKENAGFLKLGPVIMRAAREGDEYALAILQEETALTVSLTKAVIRNLQMEQEPFRVGAWGSAIVKNPYHFRLFKEELEKEYKNVTVGIADRDAAYGACQIALDILEEKKDIYTFS